MKNSFNLRLELLFLLLAVFLTIAVLFPMLFFKVDFPFMIKNAILVFISVLLFKHIFFLSHSWIDRYQKLKIALIPFSVALIFILIRLLNGFTTFADEMPLADLMEHLPFSQQHFLSRYIKVEFIASAVVAISLAIIFPFRMLVSVWREVNRR